MVSHNDTTLCVEKRFAHMDDISRVIFIHNVRGIAVEALPDVYVLVKNIFIYRNLG